MLEDLVRFFGCGKVYVNRRHDNHREDLCQYYVGRLADLRNVIIPYFESNPLRTTKRQNFEKFAVVIETMNHRKPSEFLRILRDHTPTISPDV